MRRHRDLVSSSQVANTCTNVARSVLSTVSRIFAPLAKLTTLAPTELTIDVVLDTNDSYLTLRDKQNVNNKTDPILCPRL
jgi:hypothetical protein